MSNNTAFIEHFGVLRAGKAPAIWCGGDLAIIFVDDGRCRSTFLSDDAHVVSELDRATNSSEAADCLARWQFDKLDARVVINPLDLEGHAVS